MKKIIFGSIVTILLGSCSITVPYAVTNNTIGEKRGVSKTTVIFGGANGMGGNLHTGLSINKNFGVIEAARKGKIDVIGSVDVKTTNFFIFQKVEVIVTGE